ncbi:outer membrane protein assembly factor BamA [Reinekea marinisedimentorum]|uniref:Outer membrane protein assembly factor BamA n=1 Tax=Reinekea marinisedimentorum TaxID=230495 RepID=A0A4R3I4B3_9GAMM|nr:outer membrane protein assembly factor BamA [Reinekea marinisedimentorum]TCS40715.1 outer membrane protein insertion porin family [Reinekea marinisedimentorum]
MGVFRKAALAACLVGLSALAAAESFVVDKIDVQGLQRVSLGNVLSKLSIQEGDTVDENSASSWIHDIYSLGYFYSVDVSREDDALIFVLVERPAIENIDFDGNSSFPDDTLQRIFDDVGLSKGEIFSQSLLENIQLEMERQYGSMGRYNARVDAEITPLTRNRVDIELKITEGPVAKVKYLEFVGNNVFTDIELYDVVDIKKTDDVAWWAFLSSKDKYSSAALIGDVQRLEDFYFDRGYLDFKVDSQQVSISENKEDITLALNVTEGEPYDVAGVEIVGDLKHLTADIEALNTIKVGERYSQSDVQSVVSSINKLAGENGYAFARVKDFQKTDPDTLTVQVIIQVQLGVPVYVNRIVIQGNSATNDEVIRRELRQHERALLINSKLDLSKRRLQRLGYFSSVDIKTQRITGRDDLVDLVVSVQEAKNSQISLSGGYSDGFFAAFSLSQNNFLGRGLDFSTSVSVDDDTQNYSIGIENPYFTLDGVSLGLDLYYEYTDYDDDDDATYATNALGALVTLGYPLSENQRVSFGLGASYEELWLDDEYSSQEMYDFADEYGYDYTIIRSKFGWSYNTLNGTIKATDGSSISANLEVAMPLGDLEYYKLQVAAQRYFPINDDFSFRLHTDLGYGDGYGSNDTLPFFKNFYSGGSGSVRGFESNSLGPLGTSIDDDIDASAIGGNIQIEYGAELLVPTPFAKDQSAFRTSLFLDAGNVFTENCSDDSDTCVEGVDLSEIRYSVGADLTWITAFAPLSFSLGFPLNAEDDDDTQVFSFSLGVSF